MRLNMLDEDAANSEKRDATVELMASGGWELVLERIGSEIERWREELEQQACSERRADYLRGLVAAYRSCARLPYVLEEEFGKEES